MTQNNKLFTFCNFYILLWLIYSLQSMLFGRSGGTVSTLIVFTLIGISLYHFVYSLCHYKIPVYMKCLTVLIIVFTIYGLVLIISGKTITFMRTGYKVRNFSYIKNIYISLLPIFSFYVFTRQGALNKEMLQKWSIVFFVTAVLQFVQGQRQAMLLAMMDEAEETTNNFAYLFLSMIPLLAFWGQKRSVQYIGLIISMVFVLLGMKRGAILIGVLAIAWFMFRTLKTATKKQKTWVLALSLVLLVAGYFMVLYMLQNSAYFNLRLEKTLEGDSSGRDSLYGFFWSHFVNESNPLRFLFGNGANATLTLSWNYAHNDWLEIAIDQGVLGLVVYFIYWVGFYKTWKRCSFDDEVYLATGLLLLIYFSKSLFSMSYGGMVLYATICLGYCMGRVSEYHNQSMLSHE